MPSVDETLRIEKFKIDNFLRIGYSVTDAIDAVDHGKDWHEVENLVEKGCPLQTALKIA